MNKFIQMLVFWVLVGGLVLLLVGLVRGQTSILWAEKTTIDNLVKAKKLERTCKQAKISKSHWQSLDIEGRESLVKGLAKYCPSGVGEQKIWIFDLATGNAIALWNKRQGFVEVQE